VTVVIAVIVNVVVVAIDVVVIDVIVVEVIFFLKHLFSPYTDTVINYVYCIYHDIVQGLK